MQRSLKRSWKTALILIGLIGATELSVISEAAARRGGSNFMNSPGYQRRLQESRGYVTNRSNSIVTPPFAGPRAYQLRRNYDRRDRRRR